MTLVRRRVSRSENGITNGVGIFESASGATSIVTSNNDSAVRLFDAATVAPYAAYTMPWAVNYSAVNPTNSKVGSCRDPLPPHCP